MNEDESRILDYPSEKKDNGGRNSRYEILLRAVAWISFGVFFIGWIFKVQHWAYGGFLLIVSQSCLSLSGILRYSLRKEKSIEDYLLILVYSILPIGFLFRLQQWEGATPLVIAGGISFLLYFIVRLARSFSKR